ncbi:MAG TPA: amidohydrolase [Thermoanaerobaculia bacterium]|jgi:aminobenzoyl-glutamate utilization protein B|nr:amidohydrolase [Thermoanaerobaculia bacterium]
MICRRSVSLLSILFLSVPGLAAAKPAASKPSPNKEAAVASVEGHRPELVDLANQVWAFAETALKEKRSSKVLAEYAEAQGFKVERGVAGMPTAFVASYGEGKPVIAILGEYDALPGISQKAQPTKEPLAAGAPGHGCGHNLFGAASLGAAVAVKELIAAGKLHGTVRFYGTPAEESVGGKLYMVREGLFKEVDVALAWHPSDETRADTKSTQAMVDFVVEFHGRTAHAAFDPWNGRSALDALEIFTHALNMMREHVRPSVRMHYVVKDGGDVPNVVPDHAKVWAWVRDSKHASVDELMERVRKMAQGAALAADVESTLKIQSGDYEMLVNRSGERLLQSNMEWLGPIQYTEAEQEFAKTIQRETGIEPKGLDGSIKPLDEKPGDPEGGSTDVADVSWNVPILHVSVTTAPAGAPWHAWPVAACGGMSIGHKGMTFAAKVLAATMIDLFEQPDRRAEIRREFDERTNGVVYKGYIPEGPPPVPGE